MTYDQSALLERCVIALESIAQSLQSIAADLGEIQERGLETYEQNTPSPE